MSSKFSTRRRVSTLEWVGQLLRSGNHHAKAIAEITSEKNLKKAAMRTSNTNPINILVMAGGGLKGYGSVGMQQGFQELFGEDDDFLQHFDLMCGTSVGGVGALMCSHEGTSQSAIPEIEAVLDSVRNTTFKKLNWLNLLTNGALTKQETSIATVLRQRGATTTVQPFLLRTYDVEADDDDALPGMSEGLLYEAMAATATAPGLSDRIDIVVDGVQKRFADGNVVANNPTALAVIEATKLWPNRPIGLVVSLDSHREDVANLNESIAAAKQLNPEMEFFTFLPPFIADSVSPILSSSDNDAQQAMSMSRQYIAESNQAVEVVKLLKASGARTKENRTRPCGRRASYIRKSPASSGLWASFTSSALLNSSSEFLSLNDL